MADPKNKKNVKSTVKTSKYGFTYTSREDRAQKLTNLHRLRYGKGKGQPSIHYGDDNNKWKKQGLPNTSSPTNMKKQYKVKDINNNGKIDGWEQGKYDAINNSATKMGYAMKMGSKENYSPTNFKTKDANLISNSPMAMTDPNKLKGVTGIASKRDSLPSVSELKKQYSSIKADKLKNKITHTEAVQRLKTRDSLVADMNRGETYARKTFDFDINPPRSSSEKGSVRGFYYGGTQGGYSGKVNTSDYYGKDRQANMNKYRKILKGEN